MATKRESSERSAQNERFLPTLGEQNIAEKEKRKIKFQKKKDQSSEAKGDVLESAPDEKPAQREKSPVDILEEKRADIVKLMADIELLDGQIVKGNASDEVVGQRKELYRKYQSLYDEYMPLYEAVDAETQAKNSIALFDTLDRLFPEEKAPNPKKVRSQKKNPASAVLKKKKTEEKKEKEASPEIIIYGLTPIV